jgi:hypothetical protein
MSDSRVPADQNELLKCRAGAAGFQQPEQALDCHIHDLVWRFLAGCQVENVGDTIHCIFYNFAVLNGAVDGLYSFVRFEFAVMTQCPNRKRVKFRICQQARYKCPAHFARCACD